MHCSIQNVLDYCARQLSPEAAAELERHMSGCPGCTALVKDQQHVWQALDTWEAMPVSEDFDRKLHARIAESERRRSWRSLFTRPRPVLSWGAACAAMAIALVVYMPGNHSENSNDEVEPEQVELVLEDLEMLKQLSGNSGQTI